MSSVRSGVESREVDQSSNQGGDQYVHAAAPATTSPRGTKIKSAFRRVLCILPAIGAALLSGITHTGAERNVESRLFSDSGGFRVAPEDYGKPHGEIRPHWLGRGAGVNERRVGQRSLKKGQHNRLRGLARTALRNAEVEKEVHSSVLENSRFPRSRSRFDLFEVFAGTSQITVRGIQKYNLTALQPVDILHGQDLRIASERKKVINTIAQFRPRLVIVQWPCTPWSILQDNANYKDRPDELRERRDADKVFLQLVKDIFTVQARRGDHALAENPATAASWREDEIRELTDKYFSGTSNMCRFGMLGRGGKLMNMLVR